MPPEPVLDLNEIDLNTLYADKEAIRKVNPQRYEMEQLDGIIYMDVQKAEMVGYKDVREDEFWIRGHIPGRPLLPGVLMIESAAQLASFYFKAVLRSDKFIGFSGVDNVKFRGAVVPPCRLILMGKALEIRPRRCVAYVQGYVNNSMVFEAKITGMPM